METQDIVRKAKEFAENIHGNHFRKSGESYCEHTSRVTQLLYDLGVEDENTLAASHLHHALDISHDIDLKKEFNPEIFEIVRGYKELSEDKISAISPSTVNENLIVQTYFNIAKSPKILLIRLADKADNIRSAHRLPKEWAQKVAKRALYIYSPMCKIIGLNKFVRPLEDGAFKILNPREYYKIEHYIKVTYPKINKELEEIKHVLTELFKDHGMESEIRSRTKGVYSSHVKLDRYFEKGQITSTGEYKGIMDFAGIRILVNTEEECYKCEDILQNLWDQIPQTRDDYIAIPKPNGYKSLQSSYLVSKGLVIEVQIRTYKMHEDNEFGQASHLVYKTGKIFQKNMTGNPDALKSISYAINKEGFDINQFSKSVYAYTPKGDIKKFTRGSNLLDFAYAIHKALGDTAVGGVVNGEFKSLEYVLQDGDTVEIKINKQKKAPSRKFLELVKTKKAREFIKKALKTLN
jgi:GTP pyrophosphokinase